MPFFSVIIPTYNRFKIVEQTINSVISQTFSDWECIVVDDGSTDKTRDLMDNICQKENRIKYIYQENAERSAARNNGVKNALGQYICFLDSDDAFKQDHFQKLYEAIQYNKYPIALFFTNFILKKNETETITEVPLINGDTTGYFFKDGIIPARVCIHREILQIEKFDEDIVIVEDTILWVRIAQKFPVIQLNQNTVIYALHEDNSINIKNNSFQLRLAGLKTFVKRYPDIYNRITTPMKRTIFGNTYFGLARHYIFKGESWSAIKNILISISLQRNHPQLRYKLILVVKILIGLKIREYSK